MPFSGGHCHTFSLMKSLANEGHDVEFIPLILKHGQVLKDKFAELEAYGIKVIPVYSETWSVDIVLYEMVQQYRSLFSQRHDRIIHVQSELAARVAVPAAISEGNEKTIFTVHHSTEKAYSEMWLRRNKVIKNLINRFIAVSESVKSYIVDDIDGKADRVEIVPNGIEPLKDTTGRLEVRNELGIDSNKFVVGYVGRLSSEKNLINLVRALPENMLLLIVGEGGERQKIKDIATELGKEVLFTGYRSDARLCMRALDIFCLPSTSEASPITIIEALDAGIPVVASRVGSIPALLREGEFGEICEPEEDSINESIYKVFSSLEEYRRKALDGKIYVSRNLSLQSMIEQTKSVYKKVLEEPELNISRNSFSSYCDLELSELLFSRNRIKSELSQNPSLKSFVSSYIKGIIG